MAGNSWLRSAAVMTVAAILAAQPAYGRPRKLPPAPTVTPTTIPTPGLEVKTWNFDLDQAHQLASGWEVVSGDWQVLPDPTAPSRPNTFGLPAGRLFTSLIHGLGSNSIALLKNSTEYTDLTLQVELKPVMGYLDCSGGVVLRYVNPENFYVVSVGCPSDYFQLIRMFKGKREVVRQKVVATDQGNWYKIKIEVQGNRFVAYEDNEMVLDATDSKIARGRVGLWAANDSQARFDNFALTLSTAASGEGGTGETGVGPAAAGGLAPPPPPP